MEEIEAVQVELRTSTERQAQGHEIQAARMDAMGYRMAEMKDMVAQREVRMEAQIQAMGTMLKNIQPRPAPASNTIKELLQDTDVSLPKPMKSVSLNSKESVTTATNPSGTKQHLARYAPLPQPLTSNGEASTSTNLSRLHRRNLSRLQYQRNISHPRPYLTKKTNVRGDNYRHFKYGYHGPARAHTHKRTNRSHQHLPNSKRYFGRISCRIPNCGR